MIDTYMYLELVRVHFGMDVSMMKWSGTSLGMILTTVRLRYQIC
jgi:hypothetical protein